ncbi:MAG: ribbon-helix-helix domain-containing protein [Coprococcus sp.]|nr:ribbon-helix-helix domain-containing protein [Coprococcus sp.]
MSTKKDEKDRFIKTTISFDPEQYRRIIEYCNREDRTISWVVRKALAEWLEKQDV